MIGKEKHKITIFLPSLSGGGVAPCLLNLAQYLIHQCYEVDLLLGRLRGVHLDRVPEGINVISLQRRPKWIEQIRSLTGHDHQLGSWALPLLLPYKPESDLAVLSSLTDYLRQTQPTAMLTAKTYTNIIGLMARAKAKTHTKMIISERTHLSREIDFNKHYSRWKYIRALVQKWYPYADAITAVSHGVAKDLTELVQLDSKKVHVIYNPTVNENFMDKIQEPLHHPWLSEDDLPVILGIGRLNEQKDFANLIRAFAKVRTKMSARLIILGEGPKRNELNSLIHQLGVSNDVELPGFVRNPYSYLKRATLFVLSSAYEGLPNCLIEALACGTPVISTNCPSGPQEILENGRYGTLVPVGDSQSLAQAIEANIYRSISSEALQSRGFDFSIAKVAQKYEELLISNNLIKSDSELI